MLDLEQQKDELIVNQRELRQENENRQFIEDELRKRNNELASSMDTLQLAKDQLVESERMASLGGLVAGIAHDVNTPLGVGVTATSFLQERLNTLEKAYQEKIEYCYAINANSCGNQNQRKVLALSDRSTQ